MAEGQGTSNNAILAIVVLIALALGFLYYMGVFGKETVTKNTAIEVPAKPKEEAKDATKGVRSSGK